MPEGGTFRIESSAGLSDIHRAAFRSPAQKTALRERALCCRTGRAKIDSRVYSSEKRHERLPTTAKLGSKFTLPDNGIIRRLTPETKAPANAFGGQRTGAVVTGVNEAR